MLKSDAAEDFSRAFLDAQEIVANRLFLGWVWPLAEIFRNKTDPSMKIVDAYLDPILKEALKKNRNSPSEEKDQEDIEEDVTLLDHLVRHTSGNPFLSLFRAAIDNDLQTTLCCMMNYSISWWQVGIQ